MQQQPPPPLFEQPATDPPDNGTAASRDGAVAAKNKRARRRYQVLDVIRRAGSEGATNQEISDRADIRETSVCSITHELAKLGMIEKLPQRRLSHFSDGSKSQVRHQAWSMVINYGAK